MPNVIVAPQQENPFARYLEQWMYDNKREEEAAAERKRREDEAQIASIVAQYQKLTPQQQQAVWPTLPPAAQARALSPDAIPEDPFDTVKQRAGSYMAGIDPATLNPEQISAMYHDTVTGHAQPAGVTESVVRRSAMTPEEFAKGQRMGYTEMTAAQAAEMPSKIDANEALAEQRRTPKPSGKGGGKQEGGDSAANRSVARINAQLTKLDQRQREVIIAFDAAKAAGDKKNMARNQAKARGLLAEIRRLMSNRYNILAAMEKRGMDMPAATKPAAPRTADDYLSSIGQ
jgi:hypothetical protein